MAIATTNPATGEVVKAFDPMTPDEIEVRLERAHRAMTCCVVPPLRSGRRGCGPPPTSSTPRSTTLRAR